MRQIVPCYYGLGTNGLHARNSHEMPCQGCTFRIFWTKLGLPHICYPKISLEKAEHVAQLKNVQDRRLGEKYWTT